MSEAHSRARRIFQALGAPLRLGEPGFGALEWLRPETIDGLGLDLDGIAPRIVVHVAACAPLWLVPSGLETPHGRLALAPRRVPRPRLQCANLYIDPRSGAPRVFGTAGFLANDAYAPGADYLVTAGHVLSTDTRAAFDDPVTIDADSGRLTIDRAYLSETATPVSGVPPAGIAGPFPVDAGLVRLRPGDWRDLIDRVPELLPADIADPPAVDAPLRVALPGRRSLTGRAMREESVTQLDFEQVNPDGSRFEVTLRIDELRTARLDQRSEDGDSGASVRDANDALIGIHSAYRDIDDASVGNALYSPVRPILDHFNIVALTQASRTAPLAARVRPALKAALPRPAVVEPPAAPASPRPTPDEVVDTLARTLWAEARGEGDKGMEAVACVILNRVAAPRWWGRTIVEVCRKPSQFSCWDEGTASRAALMRVTSADPYFVRATAIARDAASGRLADFTNGALHYHAIEVLPRWARGHVPCYTLGRHVFYNDIERSAS